MVKLELNPNHGLQPREESRESGIQRNGRGEAWYALRELVRHHGTKVLGDPKIGLLARANPALAPYGTMLEAFARAGLYATYLDHVEQGREKDAAIRAAADRLAPVGTPQREAAEWVCRINWRVVERRRPSPSAPAPQQRTKQRRSTPSRSISLPSFKFRRAKKKKEEKDGHPLWATVLCIARMLLGLGVMAVVLYKSGAVSLLARMDENLWRHLPETVQQLILHAPPVAWERWLVESLAQRPPMLEFAKLVLHQAWYPAGIACLMLWGGYLTVFAPLAAHQSQGLIRQMLGGAVALVVLAMLSLFGVSALYAIAFLW